jgi:hypothetical protein
MSKGYFIFGFSSFRKSTATRNNKSVEEADLKSPRFRDREARHATINEERNGGDEIDDPPTKGSFLFTDERLRSVSTVDRKKRQGGIFEADSNPTSPKQRFEKEKKIQSQPNTKTTTSSIKSSSTPEIRGVEMNPKSPIASRKNSRKDILKDVEITNAINSTNNNLVHLGLIETVILTSGLTLQESFVKNFLTAFEEHCTKLQNSPTWDSDAASRSLVTLEICLAHIHIINFQTTIEKKIFDLKQGPKITAGVVVLQSKIRTYLVKCKLKELGMFDLSLPTNK